MTIYNEKGLSMVQRSLFIMILAAFFFSCSSSMVPVEESTTDADQRNTQEKIPMIAAQPLIYDDAAEIAALSSGYGAFGSHEVGVKEIANTRYDYNADYKALNLHTYLYYPTDLSTPRPTLFFYSGYGMYQPEYYKGLLYFVASKGYNIVFLTCPKAEMHNLILVTQDALSTFASSIDTKKVGFLGHSMGAGISFWLSNYFSNLGNEGRILFPMASGYTAFNDPHLFPETTQIIPIPSNTKMIQQIYAKDYSTDIRIGIDLFLNNDIPSQNKDLMFVYGDAMHISDHGTCVGKVNYDYDALTQRTVYRALDALMDEGFNHNENARAALQEELQNDPYFNPYIGKIPQTEIDRIYILPEESYPFNCSEGGNVVSLRKEYCKALGL